MAVKIDQFRVPQAQGHDVAVDALVVSTDRVVEVTWQDSHAGDGTLILFVEVLFSGVFYQGFFLLLCAVEACFIYCLEYNFEFVAYVNLLCRIRVLISDEAK